MIRFKCRRIRPLLALWVGNDLDELQQFLAQRHLAECPPCRDYWHELQASHRVKEAGRLVENISGQNSLWSEIRPQLAMASLASQRTHSFGWLPAGALAAACLVVWLGAASSPAFAPYGLIGQRQFDGPSTAPLSPAAVSAFANDQFRDTRPARDSADDMRTPAVPVSDTRIRSF